MTPLLSAARLALDQLDRVGVEDPAEVHERISTLLDSALAGLDEAELEDELLELLAGEPGLRQLLAQLLQSETLYRSVAAASPMAPGAPEGALMAGAAQLPETGEATTHVSAFVAPEGSDAPLEGPLTPETGYEVRVHLGVPLDESLLPVADSAFSVLSELDEGIWLRVVLDLVNGGPPVVRPLFIAADGESFSCDCPHGAEHGVECAPRFWTVLPFAASDQSTDATLVIYRDAVALHVQEIALPVGGTAAPSARLVWRVTESFADLDDLRGRSASLVVNEGTSQLVVNGLGFTTAPFSLTPGQADTAVLSVRSTLHDIHLIADGATQRSRYDENLGKAHSAFVDDLGRLARIGSQVFAALFSPNGPDATAPWSLPALLRHEALLRGRPPVLQVVDATYDDRSVVWQTVYDIPMGDDVSAYEPCPSLDRLQEYAEGAVPPLCPWDEEHRGRSDVLCPWGFWGLSTLLEQPPDRPLPAPADRGPSQTCLVVRGPRLDPLDATHVSELQRTLGHPSVRAAETGSLDALAAALATDDLDVAYFYCHCGYVERAGGGGVDRYLEFDGYRVTAGTVIAWARSSATWPRDHWRSRPPLVILNGCHTSEFTSRTLGSFVPAFTVWGRAGGVIGTEVEMHQTVANHIGEELLRRLWLGSSVDAALHAVRWQLLARGNVMGLAYTPYCRGDLTVVEP